MRQFFRSLGPRDRYMVADLFFLYLIQGIYVILIGSILPMMRDQYALSYQTGGLLISAHNIGNAVAGLCAGLLPLYIGMERSLVSLNAVTFLGFLTALMTGRPALLIFAFLLTGLGRGAVSNYNNQIVSALSGGSSAPLNALHGFFAIGAVLAPILAMICTGRGADGWRSAVWVVIALGALSTVTSSAVRMDSVSYPKGGGRSGSLGFLRERRFLYPLTLMFFYLCVEASIMGWIVTYYTESGVLEAGSGQILTSLLWGAILAGRFTCTALGGRLRPPQMIRILSAGILLSLMVLLMGRSPALMLAGTVGLGLSMSGMYGTTVADAGDLFGRYPLAMGVFVTVSSVGSSIMPAIVGAVSERAGIRTGIGVLLLPAAILLILALLNRPRRPIDQDGRSAL